LLQTNDKRNKNRFGKGLNPALIWPHFTTWVFPDRITSYNKTRINIGFFGDGEIKGFM